MIIIQIVVLLSILKIVLGIYDTVIVGNTTYLDLRIGEFKKIQLPFNFTTYYSVDTGKSEISSQLQLTSDVCTVDERQFDLKELDYVPVSGKGMLFKDVVTQYQTLLNRRFLVDMIIHDNLLYTVYVDNIKIVSLDSSNNSIGNVLKSFDLSQPITTGKLIKASNTTLYFVGPNVIYKITNDSVAMLEGYESTIEVFESAAISDQTTLLIASGKSGVHVYSINETEITHLMLLDNDFFNKTVDISDIQSDGKYIYLLNRLSSIIKLNVNPSDISASNYFEYAIQSSGCQNLQYFQDHLYITCPQLHRLSFLGEGLIDKTFQSPNFNPKNIIFFNSIIIVIGHNLAKIYNYGVEMGYYHDFLMRKLVSYGDKIIIGSDYGLSLTKWDVYELEITCGLKRKGATQKYQGKVSTTINVVAECNQEYFKKNNITYKQQLKNDACLYHFPISIDFWIGRQINYLPFKIGVGVIFLVCIAVLIGWFILNSKVKNLTNAIKHYSVLTQSSDNPAPYANMVEEGDSHNDKQFNNQTGEKQMHQIGD